MGLLLFLNNKNVNLGFLDCIGFKFKKQNAATATYS